MPSEGSSTRIGTANTWVSVGILLSAIVGTGTVVTMARDLQHGLEVLTVRADQTAAAVDKIQEDVSGLKWQLNSASNDRWTGSDMRAWAWELQRTNAGMNVPKVAHDPALSPGATGR